MPTDKVKILIELIARLRVARLSDDSIAIRVGLTRSGLSRILATPEYKVAQQDALRDVTMHMDDILKARADWLAQEWAKDAVPEAMTSLIQIVRQKKDLRACLRAAEVILDRDPNATLPTSKGNGNGSNGPTLTLTRLPDAIFAKLTKDADALATAAPVQAQP